MTSTLKLKNITPSIREQILKQGWTEFTYNRELKLQYLESSPAQLMEHYQALREAGNTPELEIVTATHILK